MSSFFGSKALIWGGTALFAATVISPQGTTKAFNLMKTAGMQSRPGLLKKTGGSTSGGTTTTPPARRRHLPAVWARQRPRRLSRVVDDPVELRYQFGARAVPASRHSTCADDVGAFRFICGRRPDLGRRSDRLSRPAGQIAPPPILWQHERKRELDIRVASHDRSVDLHVAPQPLGLLDAGHARWQGQRCPSGLRADLLQALAHQARPSAPPRRRHACPLPNGLRFIMGRDMLNLAAPPSGGFQFSCVTQQGGDVPNGTGPDRTGWPTMGEALAVCPAGNALFAHHRRAELLGRQEPG